MATARSLEKGDLYPEGAEADFSHILDEYAQTLVKESELSARNSKQEVSDNKEWK